MADGAAAAGAFELGQVFGSQHPSTSTLERSRGERCGGGRRAPGDGPPRSRPRRARPR
jgi:hypothetical protein